MPESASSPHTILVVDDETAIREAVRDILELVAIPAILASNGREALDLFTTHQDRIKAVLLDLRMPIMDGIETYMRLRQISASVPVILSSGFDETMTSINLDSDPDLHFLRKPYALDALLAIVQSTMGQ